MLPRRSPAGPLHYGVWHGHKMLSTVTFSAAFKRWAFVTGQQRRDRPWQNGYAERLIGSIRRHCLDNVVVLGERHLRHLLKSYQSYYNEVRTHLSLSEDAPVSRAVQAVGDVVAKPVPVVN